MARPKLLCCSPWGYEQRQGEGYGRSPWCQCVVGADVAARAMSSGVQCSTDFKCGRGCNAGRQQVVALAGLQRGQTAGGGVGGVGVPGRQQCGAPLWRRCSVLGRRHHFLVGDGVGVHDSSRTAASSGEGGEDVAGSATRRAAGLLRGVLRTHGGASCPATR
jgi:hypothetical protein